MPTDIQELHGWLIDRSFELQNAEAELVAKILEVWSDKGLLTAMCSVDGESRSAHSQV